MIDNPLTMANSNRTAKCKHVLIRYLHTKYVRTVGFDEAFLVLGFPSVGGSTSYGGKGSMEALGCEKLKSINYNMATPIDFIRKRHLYIRYVHIHIYIYILHIYITYIYILHICIHI